MIILLQVINKLLDAGYSQKEITVLFREFTDGGLTTDILRDTLEDMLPDMDFNEQPSQFSRLVHALPKFKSALTITIMQREDNAYI